MRLIDADKLKLNFREVSERDHFEACQIKSFDPTISVFNCSSRKLGCPSDRIKYISICACFIYLIK